jgi:hypothetical protein
MSDTDAQAAAQWMLAQITDGRNHELYQMDAAAHVEKNFDADLTYVNGNGNVALSKKLLAAFDAISRETVVWERGWRGWRLRKPSDPVGKRQAD